MRRRETIALGMLFLLWGTVVSLEGRPASGDERDRKRVEEWSVSREGARELHLRNPGGNLRFLPGDGDQIRVTAEKRVRAEDSREAEAFLERMTLSRRREGDRWLFEATWPRQRERWQGSAHVNWEVRVPRGMRLDAETGGGNVAVEGVAAARLRTGGGNVAAKQIDGPLDLQTGGGNVSVQDALETRVNTGGGNISATGIRGALRVETGGGNLDIENCSEGVTAQTGGGNIDLRGVRGALVARTGAGNVRAGLDAGNRPTKAELNTGAGDIDLTLRGAANAQMHAETGHGRVSLQPNEGARVSSDQTRLETRLGDGAGSIRLNTGTGSVRIRLAGR